MSKKTKNINFQVGDIVCLQSDIDCKTPLTVKSNDEQSIIIGNDICVTWIDRQGLCHYTNVSSPMLKPYIKPT